MQVDLYDDDGVYPLLAMADDADLKYLASHVPQGHLDRALVLEGQPERLRLLLAAGADPNAKLEGNSVVHVIPYTVSQQRQRPAFQAILDSGAVLHTKDRVGRSVLHIAVVESPEEVVRYLLVRGHEVDAADNEGKTALMYCAGSTVWSEDTERKTSALLEFGARPQTRDRFGKSALDYAAEHPDAEKRLRILLQK